MPKNHFKSLFNDLELGSDGIWSSNLPESDQKAEKRLREKVANINLAAVTLKYESWIENDWSTNVKGKEHKIKNWKSTLLNTLPYLPKHEIQQQRTIID